GVVAVRGEAALLRPSLRRLTAELTVLLLAVAGVVLLRRRSLYASDGIDPYLSAVPVLLGLAVALLALRLYPWPLRLAGRLAARLRGAVNFVGLARAGRTAPAVALPLVVLVIAVSVGGFSGVVRGTIAEGRDRAAWWPLGGDVRVQGVTFDAETAGALAAVPGVRQVAPMALSSTALYSERDTGGQLGKLPVLAVDAVAYQRVLEVAGTGYRLPGALIAARRGDGPLPALVSRQLADRLRAKHADRGRMALGSRATDFRVAGVVDRFPGLPLDAKLFAVVPLQAAPEASRLRTTDFAIAGTAIDLPRLRQVATERQHAAVARTSELAATGLKPPTVRSRAALRDAAERDRLDSVLTAAFTAGAVGAAAITLLAVGFAIVVSARARGRVVSRLRTLGLSQRGARALLVWEVTPLIGVAALAGTALGAGLPWLVGPALGLERFMSGAPPRFALDPYAVAALAGLVAVAVVAAIGLEAAVNRRRNLGGVLRVGEDE
ncbi:MAG: FtsX-like permease family protein, partial [Micromonosporaceae bacterium]